MQKKLHLFIKMNKEEPFITTCYFILLFFLAFLLNFSLASIEGAKYTTNLLKNYRSGLLSLSYMELEENQVKDHWDQLKKEDDIESLGLVYQREATTNNHISLLLYQYTEGLLKTAELQLSEGRWFEADNEIVLIHSAQKIIDLNEKIIIKFYDEGEKEVTVVGFLANDFVIRNHLTVSKQNSEKSNFDYFDLFHDAYEPVAYQNIYTGIVSPSFHSDSFLFSGTISFIKLKPGTNKQITLLNLQNKYKDYGVFIDFEPSYLSYKKDVLELKNRDEIFLLICILILFCTGFCINNALRIGKKKTEFSIYYMCGLTWPQSILMSYAKSLLIFIVAIPLGTLYLNLNIKSGNFLDLILTTRNMSVVFFGLISIYIVFSFPIYLNFKRYDPITLFRKENL